ncbi:hypothetical protein DPMN_102323 [Dreissena polymorpha]|uniref:Uncharacterized protein n=1 Tax=Dreissena polymorpha TaxID=45954 RepID=A0A9D4LKA3_DREPO|nr:hypothetical protein DPMN_102323 [Dreissena polymorpha]
MPRPPGCNGFQPTVTILDLIQDIIETHILTKIHEDQTINVASRVLTRFYYSHIRKTPRPLAAMFFNQPEPFSNSSKISLPQTF